VSRRLTRVSHDRRAACLSSCRARTSSARWWSGWASPSPRERCLPSPSPSSRCGCLRAAPAPVATAAAAAATVAAARAAPCVHRVCGHALPSCSQMCNIGPRAWWHHKWLLEKFRDAYPRERKAVIPFLL
jgi:hypothetical protein